MWVLYVCNFAPVCVVCCASVCCVYAHMLYVNFAIVLRKSVCMCVSKCMCCVGAHVLTCVWVRVNVYLPLHNKYTSIHTCPPVHVLKSQGKQAFHAQMTGKPHILGYLDE